MDNIKLKMQYIGVCSLLSRIQKHLPAYPEDLELIEHALRDAVAVLPNFELVKVTGGWSLEPRR
jgi:hypothetical protein